MSRRKRDENARAGLFLVDKPVGPTSHDVVQLVRRWTGIRRVGHGGTLDPLATGLLPVFTGGATRLIEYLSMHPKSYTATIRLGQSTDTDDAEGEVVSERPVPPLSLDEIDAALAPFRGEVEQVPPVYSAVKVDGVAAHRAARRGQPVERAARVVTVHELFCEGWASPVVKLRMTVSTGTYVRAIARDLGEALGCGGHVVEMRRTAIGPVRADDAHSLDALADAAERDAIWDLASPPRDFFTSWPRVVVTEDQRRTLLHGQAIWAAPHQDQRHMLALGKDDELIAVLSPDKEAGGRWQPIKVLAHQRR